MKLLITILMILSCNALAGGNPYEEDQAKSAAFLSTIGNYRCYVQIFLHKAKHTWENSYPEISSPYMVVTQDATGVLVLQPNPNTCVFSGYKCRDYWVRSEDKKDAMFLTNGTPAKVDCPKHLSKGFAVKLIRQQSSAYDVRVLP